MAQNVIPVGSEFLVNATTTNAQLYPAVASDSSGGFVVVWRSKGQDETPANGGAREDRIEFASIYAGGGVFLHPAGRTEPRPQVGGRIDAPS